MNIELRYLLGLLNSSLLGYYYSEYFVTIDVLKNALLVLPIIRIEKTNPVQESLHDQIAAHVTRILTAKQKNPSADTSALEHEIDQYVYALYGLTPDEIRLVEESATSAGRHAEPTADPIPSA